MSQHDLGGAPQWRGIVEEYRDRLPVTADTPVVTLREGGTPLVRSGVRTPFPGLYLTGFEETVRGHLFEARRESKRLARELERYVNIAR